MQLINLINKYKNLSKPTKASLWFVICSVVQKGIAFVVTPIFTRLLFPEQYGVYNLYSTWLNIFTILITFNMSYGIFNNAMVKFEEDRDQYISSMLGLMLLTSIIAFIVYFSFKDYINKLTGLSTFIMIAMLLKILFTPAQNYWNAYQRYTFNYIALIILTLLMAFFTPLISILLIMFVGMQADGRVLSALIVQIIIGGCLWIVQFNRGKKLYIKAYWKFALSLGIPLIPHYLAQIVLNSSDKIMISKICGDDYVGYYSIAYSIGMVIQLFSASVNNSLIPWTYQQLKLKSYDLLKRIVNILLSFFALLILLFIAFGPEFVKIMAPIEYYSARWVIPPVAGSVFFVFLYTVFGNVEFYFGKTKQIAFASTACAIANVILNLVSIPVFGFIAAGYTTLICYIFFSLFHYCMMNKICKKELPGVNVYNSRIIFLISIVFVILIVIFAILYDYAVLRYSFITLAGIILLIKRNYVNSFIKIILNSKGDK